MVVRFLTNHESRLRVMGSGEALILVSSPLLENANLCMPSALSDSSVSPCLCM